jgi:hypothetical protein
LLPALALLAEPTTRADNQPIERWSVGISLGFAQPTANPPLITLSGSVEPAVTLHVFLNETSDEFLAWVAEARFEGAAWPERLSAGPTTLDMEAMVYSLLVRLGSGRVRLWMGAGAGLAMTSDAFSGGFEPIVSGSTMLEIRVNSWLSVGPQLSLEALYIQQDLRSWIQGGVNATLRR